MGADPRECERVRPTFSDYLDGELAPADTARLEEHVGICPRCRRALANLRVTLGGLSGLGRADAGDEAAAERARRAWRRSRDD